MILNKLRNLLTRARKPKTDPAITAAEKRAQEISDAVHKLGCLNVAWRYRDGKPACVLVFFKGPLRYDFWDSIAEATGTSEIDIGRDRVRIWI